MFIFSAGKGSRAGLSVVGGARSLISIAKRIGLRSVCSIAAVLLIPTIVTAQICPIQNVAVLPPQVGHPWTKLADCVSGGSAVVGGTVGGTDCTDAYVGHGQGLYNAAALSTITIQDGGTLVFLDQSSTVEVGSIVVENGGALQIDAQGCTISKKNQIRIFFSGSEGAVKGIDVQSGGTLRMWGRHGNTAFNNDVSWAHLAHPAGPASFSAEKGVAAPVTGADDTLDIDRIVDWHVGDWLVVAGTNFSPDSGEIVQIQTVTPNSQTGHTAITLNQSLVEYHYGGASPTCNPGDAYCGPSAKSFNDGKKKNYGVDERAEVGLLTRNIHLTSITPNPYEQTHGKWVLVSPQPAGLHWGGEILLESGFTTAEIAGVQIDKFGGDKDGQFPIYFQGTGKNPPIISSNSIHHSYNKCIALAGLTGTSSNPITINDNVCARIVGNIFYLRTGAEQNLSFIHNLGVGAMSNGFTLNPDSNAPPPYQLWWAGDNLTNQPTPNCTAPGAPELYNCYDGLNINFTDNPGVEAVQSVSFASAGFWITNPANYFEANSIAGCQDQGIGFWYDLTQTNATVPLGIMHNNSLVGFQNNRAHGCYYGLNTPAQSSQAANYTPQNSDQLDLIAHFDGITATRNRYAGIWVRPNWYSLTNVRLAGNIQGASLVSAGGTEGSPPGEWSQITGGVFVGESMNNPERFGPCPYYTDGVIPPHDTTPPPPICAESPGAPGLGIGYPDPKRNQLGYMFYDGPARIENSRFVNFLVDPSPLLTKKDVKYLNAYTAIEKMPCDSGTAFMYEGDAAMGWFQSNVNSYPPTQYTDNVSFENIDLRHEVYTQEVGVTCISSIQVNFQDGDKNTVIRDHDASLSGYQVVDQAGTPIWGKIADFAQQPALPGGRRHDERCDEYGR
jgi:G8 domain